MWERGAREEEIPRQKEQHTQMSRNKSAHRASEELRWDWGCMWRRKWWGLKWHSIKWLYFNLFLIKFFKKKIMGLWNETRSCNTMEVKYWFCFSRTYLVPYWPGWFASNLRSTSWTSMCVSSGAYTGVGCSWCLKIYIVFTWLLW